MLLRIICKVSTSSIRFLQKTTQQSFSSSPVGPVLRARRGQTKKACISLLQSCKSMKQLKQIHCQIIVSSLGQTRGVVNDLLAFCTDPKSGNLSYAAKIFETFDQPYLFLYNLMIKAFTKKDRLKEAMSLFGRMRSHKISPDNFTYPFIMKSIASLCMVLEGRIIHALVVKSGFEFDPFTRNSLMDMYAELGCIEASQSLFDETFDKDVICWNVLIGAYIKCGKFDDAILVYRKMVQEDVMPDEATLISTLSACIAQKNLELGKTIHRYMDEEIKFSIPLGNALLDMYAKCGSINMARRFFDSMPSRNVISWTSMVSGYVNCGNLDEARQLFDCSPTKDVVLWTAMINGYVQHSLFDEAFILFREMQQRGIKPDKFTVVSLLTACASLGALEQGRWIHGYIKDNSMQLDVVVGTALIDMYSKCGMVEKSLEVFQTMGKKDTETWTSIIYGLAVNGKTGKAIELFSEMVEVGVRPNNITFVAVLTACTHGGLVDKGRQYFRDLKEIYQIEPKLEHYGCLVDLLGRAGFLDEAEELIRSIPKGGVKNMLPLWGALLAACKIHGNIEMGERLAKTVSELEDGNSGVHTLIANIYATTNKWEHVNKVRKKMKDLGIKKTPGCSSIEVNGAISEFLVGDTSHPESQEIYLVLHSIYRILYLERNLDIDVITLYNDSQGEFFVI